MSDKLMAEWFWVDRWTLSSAFLLPAGPRGLYREMLSQAWRRGGRLPNNHEAIRRAVGFTSQEWARCWPRVKPFWRVDGESLVNDTQLEVYAEAKERQENAERRGRAGGLGRAQARAQALLKQSVSTAQGPACGLDGGKPPSPSPSPSLQDQDQTPKRHRGKVFVGTRLIVSRRQHETVIELLGADAGYVDWMGLYPEWDAALIASQEDFDTLEFIKRKARDFLKARRRGGALFSQPSVDDDWQTECERVHKGECGHRVTHKTRMDLERFKGREAAS